MRKLLIAGVSPLAMLIWTWFDVCGFVKGPITFCKHSGVRTYRSGAMLYADVRNAIGATEADTVILNAHFGMPDPTMPQSAARTVDVAKAYSTGTGRYRQESEQATLPSDQFAIGQRLQKAFLGPEERVRVQDSAHSRCANTFPRSEEGRLNFHNRPSIFIGHRLLVRRERHSPSSVL